MKAYSQDLRLRILSDSEFGMESDELAEKYNVSRSWVDRIKQRKRDYGEIAPRPRNRGRRLALAERLDELRELVEAKPDRTLEELKELLGGQVGTTSIWRALKRLGFTVKKSPQSGRTR